MTPVVTITAKSFVAAVLLATVSGTGAVWAQDDCIGLKGTDGAITECAPVAGGKSDKPLSGVTGSLTAGKTDRGGAQLLASELIGQTVYASDGTIAGKLVDIVMASSLESLSVVIRTGGLMGVGGREFALPASQAVIAKTAEGQIRLTLAATSEQLQRAPVFDRTALMR